MISSSIPFSHPGLPYRRIAWLIALSLLLHLLVAGMLEPLGTVPAQVRRALQASLMPVDQLPAKSPATGLTDASREPGVATAGPSVRPVARPSTPTATAAANVVEAATRSAMPGNAALEPGPPLESPRIDQTHEPALPRTSDLPPAADVSAAFAPPPDSPDALPALATDLPGPAQLHYRLTATDPRSTPAKVLNGNGLLSWERKGNQYQLGLRTQVNIIMLPVTALTLNSDGRIDAGGLQPTRYVEERRGKSPQAINFNRDQRQSITFSASDKTLPLAGGAQDRLSILLQLSAWMRADPKIGRNGNRIEVFVAGVRGDGETWRFSALGEATVATAMGPLRTWHFKRIPRPDSNDRGVEIWLAPEHGGYPARILFTEPNTTRIDLVLERIEQAL